MTAESVLTPAFATVETSPVLQQRAVYDDKMLYTKLVYSLDIIRTVSMALIHDYKWFKI